MITTTTTLRQGLLRASKRRIIDGSRINWSAAPTLLTDVLKVATQPSSNQQQQRRRCFNSFSEPKLLQFSDSTRHRSIGLVTDTSIFSSQLGSRHLYQTSAQTQLQDVGANASGNKVHESENSTSLQHHRGALSESIRSIILQDLRSVDADNNGKINAEELMALLRKHSNTFTESEILELGELFYTSLGASSVDIDRFMVAIDAAVASRGLSVGNTDDDVVLPLAAKGKFRTHPLGIGTCASEYM
jgi:hypothetical protein